jgi:signal transduction histidine kinase
VALRVDDDGKGIAPEHRDQVFERFVRLDEARNRDFGGSGLGLAIVRKVATASGGSVEVDDSPLGGARLVVTLPHT